MKFTKFFAAGAVFLALTGCKTVDIQDGKIPNGYLSEAKKIEGVYSGQFNGVPGELIITLEGNKPVVTFRNSQGNDILNNNCHSSFGNLEKVYLKGSSGNYQLDGALFAFSAGDCSLMVRGRDMQISFRETGKGVHLNLSLLKDIHSREVCSWTPGAPPSVPPQQVCNWENSPEYIHGVFSR